MSSFDQSQSFSRGSFVSSLSPQRILLSEGSFVSPNSPLTPKRTHSSQQLREPSQSPYQLPIGVTTPSEKPKEPSRIVERLSSSKKNPFSAKSSPVRSPPTSPYTSYRTSAFSSLHSPVSSHILSTSPPVLNKTTSPRSPKEDVTPTKAFSPNSSNKSVLQSPSPFGLPVPKSLFSSSTTLAEESVQKMYENEARSTQSERALLWLAREFRARQEYSKSASYYEQLIDLYDVDVHIHFELGEIYHIALKEYESAVLCYNRVLEEDPYHVHSLVNLGLLYFDGLGVGTNRYNAVNLWNRALRQDHRCVLALQCIAYCYYSGLGGLPVSYIKARDFARLVLEYADVSNPMERTIASDAAYVLAHMYRRGYDTPKDFKRAIHYYEKSASLGNHRAYISIARMFQNELKNEESAAHYFDHYMKQAAKAEQSSILE